ncbi:MAG: exo-alpha-sialidase [Fibrobacter sp.]|nr:exo-alpha-sialidase [Fibrobacter sp.]
MLFFTASLKGKALSTEQTFGYVKIGGGGYICSIIESDNEQNVFYAKSDVGGIYKWDELSKSWVPLFSWVSHEETTFLGTESFAVDPNSPNIIYAMAGTSYWNGGKSALLRSKDYGKTWETHETTAKFKVNGNGSYRQKGEALAIDPSNGSIMYFGTRYHNGLFKSADSGKTWDKVSSFPDSIGNEASFSFILFDENNCTDKCSTIIVGVHKTGNNLFISNDFGQTWNPMGGLTVAKPQRGVLSSKDKKLFVTYSNGSASDGYGGVYKYDLTTKTWEDITPSPNRGYSGISILKDNPQQVVVSTFNYWSSRQPWGWGDEIYYSNEGGDSGSWVRKNSDCTMNNNGIGWMEGRKINALDCRCNNEQH